MWHFLARARSILPWFALAAAAGLSACKSNRPAADPAAAARQFFQQIADGRAHDAYESAAFAFKAQQPENLFVQTTKEIGLAGPLTMECGAPEADGRTTKLAVEITTAAQQHLSFVVTLVDEAAAWRVYALRSPRREGSGIPESRFSLAGRGAGFSNALSEPVPDDKEVRRLVNKAIQTFGQAIEQRSFADFYESVSVAWRKQLTQGQLSRAFQPFIDNNVKLGGVSDAELHLDGPPAINTDGLLVVNGHYATAPYQVFFNLKFVYELPSWKLFGIDVNLQR